MDKLQRQVVLGTIILFFVLGGYELLPRGIVVGVEQTLNRVFDGVVLVYGARCTRPLRVFKGRVDFVNVGDAVNPGAFLSIP